MRKLSVENREGALAASQSAKRTHTLPDPVPIGAGICDRGNRQRMLGHPNSCYRLVFGPPAPANPGRLWECKQLTEQGSNSKITPKEAEYESGSNLRSDPVHVRPDARPTKETAYDCAKDVCS